MFHNILFVGRGSDDARAGLKQVFRVAANTGANVKVLIVYPPLPATLAQYRDKWQKALESDLREAVAHSREPDARGEVNLVIEEAELPAEVAIQHVLRHGHDLVFKEAEPLGGGTGHKAMDMELLRKCPCPVWLARLGGKLPADSRVAVAIDPDNADLVAKDLAINLLKRAAALAALSGTELQIVSCWECEYEGFLRNNPFASLPADEVSRTLVSWERSHAVALMGLIAAAGLSGNYRIHHLRGRPDDMIPAYITREGVDILVMGTVARTGIPGFIMGNTAENIVQKLQCSLLALKPGGFVSPVKAY